MRILIGCEYSGRVREAFRALGHDAWSCDLLDSEDDSPYHIKGDVLEAANRGGVGSWDFPPALHTSFGLWCPSTDPQCEGCQRLIAGRAETEQWIADGRPRVDGGKPAMRAPWMAAPYPPVWPCAMRID